MQGWSDGKEPIGSMGGVYLYWDVLLVLSKWIITPL